MKKMICILVGGLILLSALNLTSASSTVKTTTDADDELEKYAVIIGISDYSEEGRSWMQPSADLPLPAKNAIDFKESIETHGWENAEIHLLLNESATKANILSELEWLKEKTGKVLFFFNGHGASIEDDDGDEGILDGEDEALVPHDIYGSDKSRLIRDDDLNDILNDFQAQETILIFCTCHAEGMIENSLGYSPTEVFNGETEDYIRIHNDIVEVRNTYNEGLVNELEGDSRVVLASCGEEFSTVEYPDGYEILGFKGVPFVHYLIQGLEGAADISEKTGGNNDGLVSIEEAFNYMKPRADVVNAMGFIRYLTKADFGLGLITGIATVYCTILAIYVTIDGLISGTSMPLVEAFLWLNIFLLVSSWFNLYGIHLPLAQINDYDTSKDIVLTVADQYPQDKSPNQEFNKEEYENDIKAQLEILDEYFGEEDDISKSVFKKPFFRYKIINRIFDLMDGFVLKAFNFKNVRLSLNI